jgi:dephospho-CoA kinase
MLRVGVTGGIGSGKSLVCSYLSSAGIPVIFADPLAKSLMQGDPKIRKSLIGLLGPETYMPDGALNRGYVAERLFSNAAIRKKVDALVHPRVEEEVQRQFAAFEREGHTVAIVEAALIFEAGLNAVLDYIIVVDAPEEIRLQRIVEREGLTVDEVRKRMKTQWSSERKAQKASYVIRNDGSREALESASRFVAKLLQTMTSET